MLKRKHSWKIVASARVVFVEQWRRRDINVRAGEGNDCNALLVNVAQYLQVYALPHRLEDGVACD
jgi:hypothetical protein